MVVSAENQLSPVVLDEVEDEDHIDDQVGRLMLQVVLLQMSSMEMSTTRLEAHEDLDVQDVEEEGMRWSIVMPSIPVRMRLLVMMDRWSLLLPGEVDGPQAGCALLPCEIRWGFLDLQSQDDSDGGQCLPVSCRHPGLHDHCLDESLSLSLVDDSDACCRCS